MMTMTTLTRKMMIFCLRLMLRPLMTSRLGVEVRLETAISRHEEGALVILANSTRDRVGQEPSSEVGWPRQPALSIETRLR